MRVVVALGGNALLRRGQPVDAATQRGNVSTAVAAIAELARDHEVVVTHGNGPQVGLLALQSEALRDVPPYPLDVLGAESEGMIGYLLEQQLINVLVGRPVATLLTQVTVNADDPAFANPTKPIGPIYDRATAERLAAEHGWSIAPDGEHYRRIVPSPEPRSIIELAALKLLVSSGVLVVCVGGGGIPVVLDRHQRLHGIEAVIDKDLSAAVLATHLDADALLMLTDVPNVEVGWRTPQARALTDITVDELRAISFAPGSMAPKIEAACRFIDATGGTAAIGALADAPALLRGGRGTRITAGTTSPGVRPPSSRASVATAQSGGRPALWHMSDPKRPITVAQAREIAIRAHGDQKDRDGSLHIAHVARVIEGVPRASEYQRVAWLHDVVEDSDITIEHLRDELMSEEIEALRLLTRDGSEPYLEYVRRICQAEGKAGLLARAVKEADMLDNLRRCAGGRDPAIAQYGEALGALWAAEAARGPRRSRRNP